MESSKSSAELMYHLVHAQAEQENALVTPLAEICLVFGSHCDTCVSTCLKLGK
jgi:hypothetical protein